MWRKPGEAASKLVAIDHNSNHSLQFRWIASPEVAHQRDKKNPAEFSVTASIPSIAMVRHWTPLTPLES